MSYSSDCRYSSDFFLYILDTFQRLWSQFAHLVSGVSLQATNSQHFAIANDRNAVAYCRSLYNCSLDSALVSRCHGEVSEKLKHGKPGKRNQTLISMLLNLAAWARRCSCGKAPVVIEQP